MKETMTLRWVTADGRVFEKTEAVPFVKNPEKPMQSARDAFGYIRDAFESTVAAFERGDLG